jgi:hypothetical protein
MDQIKRETVLACLKDLGARRAGDSGISGLVDLPDGKGRTQAVSIAWGDEGLWILSPFASDKDLTAASALKLAEQIYYGIGTVDGNFVVKHWLDERELSEEILISHYAGVAVAADFLERFTGDDKF